MPLRQPSLKEWLEERPNPVPLDASATPLEVYDFFAGAGGFSEGARAAGCRVVMGLRQRPGGAQDARRPTTRG